MIECFSVNLQNMFIIHLRAHNFCWFQCALSCRYASLYFCMCTDQDDNELEVLEIIHHFVEILDRYFGSVSKTYTVVYRKGCKVLYVVFQFPFNCLHISSLVILICLQVCELDLIFNFHKVCLLVFSSTYSLFLQHLKVKFGLHHAVSDS